MPISIDTLLAQLTSPWYNIQYQCQVRIFDKEIYEKPLDEVHVGRVHRNDLRTYFECWAKAGFDIWIARTDPADPTHTCYITLQAGAAVVYLDAKPLERYD